MNPFERPIEEERAQPAVSAELVTDTEQQRRIVAELVPVYQRAFAGDPWFEVSRCEGCPRGFSAQEPGEVCADCGTSLTQEAYPAEELSAVLTATVEQSQSTIYV